MKTPGTVKLWVTRSLLLAFELGMFGMLAFATLEYRAYRLMFSEGLRTTGSVLKTEYLGPSQGPEPMYVTVEYAIDGTTYENTIRVGGEAYAHATAQSDVTLYYSASDPWRIALDYPGTEKDLGEDFIARIVIGSGIMLFVLLFGIFALM